jgi:hypothetical protein
LQATFKLFFNIFPDFSIFYVFFALFRRARLCRPGETLSFVYDIFKELRNIGSGSKTATLPYPENSIARKHHHELKLPEFLHSHGHCRKRAKTTPESVKMHPCGYFFAWRAAALTNAGRRRSHTPVCLPGISSNCLEKSQLHGIWKQKATACTADKNTRNVLQNAAEPQIKQQKLRPGRGFTVIATCKNAMGA